MILRVQCTGNVKSSPICLYPKLIPHRAKALASSRCAKQCAVLSKSYNGLIRSKSWFPTGRVVHVVSASPGDGVLTATAWVVVLAATTVTFSYMIKAFLEAKEAIDRREERQEAKQKEDERKEAERLEKLKKMFERL